MAKQIEIISESRNYTAGNLGELTPASLLGYEFPNPTGGDPFPGKAFLAEKMKTSGMEVSFQVMPPNAGMPFSHKHRKNEELYIVLKGTGEFTVDGAVIPLKEGSLVKVLPDGSRSWKNTGKEPMIMICIQAVAGTMTQFTGHDGYLS